MEMIERHALGAQLELGSLFDAINRSSLEDFKLWKCEDVQNQQEILEKPIFSVKFSSSLDEARENFGIDKEALLGIEIGHFKLHASAQHLEDNFTETNEARVDITCMKTNQTRTISLESIKLLNFDEDVIQKCPQATHFVVEVTEGVIGNISIVKKCSSVRETKIWAESLSRILARFVSIPSPDAEAAVEWEIPEKFKSEDFEFRIGDAIDGQVKTFKDVLDVLAAFPCNLKPMNNTLYAKLMPVSFLDSTSGRKSRELDESLVTKVHNTLKKAKLASVSMIDLENMGVLPFFPKIQSQIMKFREELEICDGLYRENVKKVLFLLKDGVVDDKHLMAQLEKTVRQITKQSAIGCQFVSAKCKECKILFELIEQLESYGFNNALKDSKDVKSSVQQPDSVELVLNLCGHGLGDTQHRLQSQLKSISLDGSESSGENEVSGSDDDESIEWFEDDRIVSFLQQSAKDMREVEKNNNLRGKLDIKYTFGAIAKAFPPMGIGKPRKTCLGDIIMVLDDENYTVSGYFPKPPCDLQVAVSGQTLSIAWDVEPNNVLPCIAFLIRCRPRGNAELDSFDNYYGDNEVWDYHTIDCKVNTSTIDKYLDGNLNSNTEFEIQIATETKIGFTNFCNSVITRTHKKPSVAASLIDFYLNNTSMCNPKQNTSFPRASEEQPWETVGGKKPWDLTDDTLFLGFETSVVRRCSTRDYFNELAVLIVDVVPEYAPEILAAEPTDDNARMIMFVGETGSGKTTQINAFISFLLGGELSDSHRILLIDDRNLDQTKSITRYITVYRIRPLAESFNNNTFYIIDTPGYGDTQSLHTGLDRDKFITASMEVMFNTLPKMNTIVLTSKSGLTRASLGITAAVTNIFQLFAKNVRHCLRTILTFSDAGVSPAIQVLNSLDWPSDRASLVEVNNSAFRIADADNYKVRSCWKLSMEGQQEVLRMLGSIDPVPTAQSAQVTHDRISLSDTCTIVEKKVFQTATETANLLLNLDAISKAIGASAGEKVPVKKIDVVQKDVKPGKFTTLCVECNHTCHEICSRKDDNDKQNCAAMDGGQNNAHCRVCPKKCFWKNHKNASFILVPVERTEYVVPDDLIKQWNSTTNSLEGAALDAMAKFIGLQDTLTSLIDDLVAITEKLKHQSLKHNPSALLNYLKTLVKTAKAQGASPEQLEALTAAQNAMLVQDNIARGNLRGFNESQVLSQVVEEVKEELERRNRLSHMDRAAEEKRPCKLYNQLLQKLPGEVQLKAPPKLREKSKLPLVGSDGALFPENLRAIVQLLKVILKTGSVTAVHSECVTD